jgi:AcrR family transcriptional regulator
MWVMSASPRQDSEPQPSGTPRRRRAPAANGHARQGSGIRRELVENEMYEQASRLFALRGYASTSLQDIADAMGLTRPALYYYVKSKEELLSKLVTEITEGAAAEIRAVARGSALHASEKLRQIAYLNALRRAQQPTRFLLLARSEADLPPDLAKAHEAGKRSLLRDVVRVIDEGIASGEFRPTDSRIAAFAVIGMCNWVAWWQRPGSGYTGEAIAEQVATLAVAMLAQRSGRGSGAAGPRAAVAQLREDLLYLERLLELGEETAEGSLHADQVGAAGDEAVDG